ncbi:GFA family protein [Rhodobacter capsulatus]|uniref:GFA family protein n=1 Tax=Rhodobacter capsulatus TaxID=1061 RepID=UPI004029CEE7
MTGRCTCGQVTYRMTAAPMITHACHCSWCQRETGTAFALNTLIETDRLEVTGVVDYVMTPSASGKGQEIARCPSCRVAVFSHYAGAGRVLAFVRVGTLDTPAACPPDVHIFTSTKQPWLVFPESAKVFAEYYKSAEVWSPEALDRRRAALAKVS